MQINSGVRSILVTPWVYRLATRLLGSEANKQWFIDEILALSPGHKLVDVGCGPAEILDRLPRVNYVGLDVSDAYVEAARRKFSARPEAVFRSGNVDDWLRDSTAFGADVVLMNGVLHHVDDDETIKLLE